MLARLVVRVGADGREQKARYREIPANCTKPQQALISLP